MWSWREQALLRKQIIAYYEEFGDETDDDLLAALKHISARYARSIMSSRGVPIGSGAAVRHLHDRSPRKVRASKLLGSAEPPSFTRTGPVQDAGSGARWSVRSADKEPVFVDGQHETDRGVTVHAEGSVSY
jgi:hypothetical protein